MVLELRWFPNSCVFVGTEAGKVVIDPGRNDDGITGLGVDDVVLLTHHHGDHVNRAAVEALSGDATKLFGPRKAQRKAGRPITVVGPGDKMSVEGITIEAVHAYNPKRTLRPTFHRRGECVGYVLQIGGKRIYHAGDTGLIGEMSTLGQIDVAFLPIGGTFTLDIGRAVEAVNVIKPQVVVPMHMLKADPEEFKALVEKETLSKVRVLAPGSSFVY
jgi:L-ascorbate metabolism protein UlaG (beta-lactamase superfamily)